MVGWPESCGGRIGGGGAGVPAGRATRLAAEAAALTGLAARGAGGAGAVDLTLGRPPGTGRPDPQRGPHGSLRQGPQSRRPSSRRPSPRRR
jgi:hypothetical protein